MPTLIHQRCFNHAVREAVARCPECGRFFCRECITEHDDRVICASCLKKVTSPAPVRRTVLARLARLAGGTFGLLIAWFFFFLIGAALLKVPASFHEGTLWQTHVFDDE